MKRTRRPWRSGKAIKDGVDVEALAWMTGQTSVDKNASASSTAATISLPDSAVNLNIGTLVGSYGKIAHMLDEIAETAGTKGIMLIFDDFLIGMDDFGQKIQPLMRSRQNIAVAA